MIPMWLFQLSSYTPNPYALPPLTVGLLAALLGLDVFIRERGTGLSRVFFWLCVTTGLWLVSYAGIYSAIYMPIAKIWAAIQNFALVFIPSLFYLFTITVTKQVEKNRKLIWLSFIISTAFFSAITITDTFVSGVNEYAWGYAPKANIFNGLFLVFLLGTMVICLRDYWLQYRRSSAPTHKRRMRAFFVIFLIAHLAVVDSLAPLGLPVYSFGYVFIFIALILAARGIWLYRLVNITPAFAARQIITTMGDSLLVLDDRGGIQIANQTACDLFGQKMEDLIGRPIKDVNVDFITQEKLEDLFKNKQPSEYEVDLITARGKTILSISTSVLVDESEEPLATVCIAKDVTEKKRIEEALVVREDQLRQAQKMEAIGRLAGGIAHDFNNIVTPIMGYTDMVMRGIDADSNPHRYLQQVKMAAERAKGLANQLLTFSKHGMVAPRVLDVNKILGEMHKMMRRLIGEDIEIVILFTENVWPIKIDPVQLEQVIINMALNARDAMPDGGKFVVETNNVQVSDYIGKYKQLPEGKYVMLAFSDTGHGMDKDTQVRIFEPFFTTKEKGKGTGLGLSTSYGIVEQAGGHIVVYSEPNHGTTMKILLPAVQEQPQDLTIEDTPKKVPRGNETILLVEDEPLVREMVHTVLQENGYKVIETRNGGEALFFLKNNKQTKIDLVITDVVMPQVGGKALADEVRKMYPDMKILFTSGYTDGVIFEHGIVDSEIDFLQKPFSTMKLAVKVRSVLDSDKLKKTISESASS